MSDGQTTAAVIPTVTRTHLAEVIGALPNWIAPVLIDNRATNWSVARAWNEGLTIARTIYQSEYVFFLNDDVVALEPALGAMLDQVTFSDRCAFATGSSLNTNYEIQEGSAYPDFASFVARVATVDRLGGFDENFFPAYFEDDDIMYRAKLEGLYVRACARVKHYKSQTMANDVIRAQRIQEHWYEANKRYYCSKWGGMPRFETFKTPFEYGN